MIDNILKKIVSFSSDHHANFSKKMLRAIEYNNDDLIVGTTTPVLRRLAKDYESMELQDLEQLIKNQMHEARMLALIIMIKKFKTIPDTIFNMYLDNINYINNWDLIDVSAPWIPGVYCYNNNKDNLLIDFSTSEDIWKKRIAKVSTWHYIKKGSYNLTLYLCKSLMSSENHLIQKACGWMLRELGKRDKLLLIEFLKEHKDKLPRITLSYATEKLKNQTL